MRFPPLLMLAGATAAALSVGCTDTTLPTPHEVRGVAAPPAPAVQPAGGDTLMHLYVGSTWSYDVADSTVDTASASTVTPTTHFTIRVSGDTLVGGERWADVDSLGQLEFDDPSGYVNHLTNRADGVYISGPLTTVVLPPLYPTPVFHCVELVKPGENAVFYAARGVGIVSVVKLFEQSRLSPTSPWTFNYRVVKLTSYSPGPH